MCNRIKTTEQTYIQWQLMLGVGGLEILRAAQHQVTVAGRVVFMWLHHNKIGVVWRLLPSHCEGGYTDTCQRTGKQTWRRCWKVNTRLEWRPRCTTGTWTSFNCMHKGLSHTTAACNRMYGCVFLTTYVTGIMWQRVVLAYSVLCKKLYVQR